MRVMLSVPLRVHGITTDGETFAMETKSHTVSLHGASIELEQAVALGRHTAAGKRAVQKSKPRGKWSPSSALATARFMWGLNLRIST